jgi:hypothetical protein
MHELFKLSKEIVDLDEEEAISMIREVDGLYQVEERDGESCQIVEGFRDDRITMKIENGIVKEAYIF